jgi:hypothetical protein
MIKSFPENLSLRQLLLFILSCPAEKTSFTMSNAASQAQAQQLNAKMESEARTVLDGIERQWLRKVARNSYSCVVACFDKAGTSGPSEVLDQCSRNCQVKYQHANAIVQNVSSQHSDP